MENFKFYDGINQDNLKKAFDELKKDGYSVTDVKFVDVDNKFVLFYDKVDITKRPLADLQKYIEPFNSQDPQRPINNMMEYLKEYWYIVGIIAIGLFYFFVIYKK